MSSDVDETSIKYFNEISFKILAWSFASAYVIKWQNLGKMHDRYKKQLKGHSSQLHFRVVIFDAVAFPPCTAQGGETVQNRMPPNVSSETGWKIDVRIDADHCNDISSSLPPRALLATTGLPGRLSTCARRCTHVKSHARG